MYHMPVPHTVISGKTGKQFFVNFEENMIRRRCACVIFPLRLRNPLRGTGGVDRKIEAVSHCNQQIILSVTRNFRVRYILGLPLLCNAFGLK